MALREKSSFDTYALPMTILLAAFIFIAWLYHQSWWEPVDLQLLKALNPIRTVAGIRFFGWLTFLGTSKVIIPFIIIAGIFLIWKKHLIVAVLLAGDYFGERLINFVLKHLFQRARPPLHHLIHASGYSFPSGHSMNSLSVYGFAAVILYYLVKNKAWRILGMAIFILLIFLITFSRNYLNVHYFTDVTAGWCIAGAWLLLMTFLMKKYW